MKSKQTNSKSKKTLLIGIIAVALLILIAAIVVVCLLPGDQWKSDADEDEGNSNSTQAEYSISGLGNISGQFTKRSIKDTEDALLAACDGAKLLGLSLSADELKEVQTNTISDHTYYRLEQTYGGIPVYGHGFVVVAGSDGKAVAMTSHATEITEEVDLTPTATEEEILSGISAYMETASDIKIQNLSQEALVVYHPENSASPQLAYDLTVSCDGGSFRVIASAKDGSVWTASSLNFFSTNPQQVSQNEERNIYLYNANQTTIFDMQIPQYVLNGVSQPTNDSNLLCQYAVTVHDYFQLIHGRKGVDDKNGALHIIYNGKIYFPNGATGYNAAAMLYSEDRKTYSVIEYGYSYPISLETLAHEYTHLIERHASGMTYSGESGAIMEALSDIFGELLEDWSDLGLTDLESDDYRLDNSCDWFHASRNIRDPFDTYQPKAYHSQNWHPIENPSDRGGVHHNSTVISHAAYLMTQKLEGCSESLTTLELSHLFYRTIALITNPDCTFYEFRDCVETAAEIIGLSKAKRKCIATAFDEANIGKTEKVDNEFEIFIENLEDDQFYSKCIIRIAKVNKDGTVNEHSWESITPTGTSTPQKMASGSYEIRVYLRANDELLFARRLKVNGSYGNKFIQFYVKGHQHIYMPHYQAATCTEDGWEKDVCGVCLDVRNEVIVPAKGHQFGDWQNVQEPTTTETGSRFHTCLTCGFTETEVLSPLQHIWTDATCTTPQVCLQCGKMGAPALGHQWKEGEDCDSPSTCTVCGAIGTSALGHQWSEAGDCYSPSTCTVCGENSDAARGHRYNGSGCMDCDAPQPSEGLAYKFYESQNGYYVTGIGDCTDLDIVIPDLYKGYPVVVIGNMAFYNEYQITGVVIPDSVFSIGAGAFQGCSGLTEIHLPDSLTKLNINAFNGCKGLTSVTLPNGLTSIGQCAFEDCTGLVEVILPDTITKIEIGAFYGCTSLASINIPDSVTEIEHTAFFRCKQLTSITLPEGITRLQEASFYECTKLSEIILPNSLEQIDASVFYGCKNLTSIVIPSNVTVIGKEVFKNCSALTAIYLEHSDIPAGWVANWYASNDRVTVYFQEDWHYVGGVPAPIG